MGTLVGYTTVTLEGGGVDGAEDISLTLVATPSTYANTESVCEIHVFTDPSSWIDKFTALYSSDAAADLHPLEQGVAAPFSEDVTLSRQEEDDFATGNLEHAVKVGGTITTSIYGWVHATGSSGNPPVNIQLQQSGTSKLRSTKECLVVSGYVSYDAKIKKWYITNMVDPIVTICGVLLT